MQDQPNAPGLILGHHIGADRPHPFDFAFVPEQLQKAEGEQPAVDRLDAGIVVEQAEDRADWLAVDLGNQRKFRHDQVLKAGGHVINLACRERHEAPGARQAGVIDLEKHLHLIGEA